MDTNTIRIFSFCGGGTKGYGSNRFMQKFIQQWGIPQADFWKYADVMCGTSIGAILAFGYSFGKILLKEYEVIFSDKNDKVVKTLSKEINITGNNTLLIENSDVIFVCVDTPITNDKEYNTIQISHIVDDFIECFKNEVSINGKTLIITSTVNPYTTKVVQERLSAYGVQVAYLPTFIEYTNITNEILNTSFLLLGNSNHEITSLISNIFTKVLDTPVRIQQMGYTSSELTKIMIDCFSSVQKTFVNTFKDMFDNMSLSHEFTMASDTLNKDFKKGNSFISNGRPFDGPNISNVNFVVTNLLEQQELSGELFNTVTEINNSRIDNIVIKYTKENPNKEYHVVGSLNKTMPMVYDPMKDANKFEFYVNDTLGNVSKVIYRNTKPQDIEKTERIVLIGAYQEDHFEASQILSKCPSKYNEEPTNL